MFIGLFVSQYRRLNPGPLHYCTRQCLLQKQIEHKIYRCTRDHKVGLRRSSQSWMRKRAVGVCILETKELRARSGLTTGSGVGPCQGAGGSAAEAECARSQETTSMLKGKSGAPSETYKRIHSPSSPFILSRPQEPPWPLRRKPGPAHPSLTCLL